MPKMDFHKIDPIERKHIHKNLNEFNVIWRWSLGLIPQMSTVLSDIMFNPGLQLWNSDIINSLCKEIVFLFIDL